MDRDGNAGASPQLDGGEQVLVERVHAAGPDQGQQMQRAVVPSCVFAQLHQLIQGVELSRGDALGDTHDVLRHDAARTEVQVTDLAVAHLPVREPDVVARGADQRPRILCVEAIERRRAGQADGVPGLLRTLAVAVEDHEDHARRAATHGGECTICVTFNDDTARRG